MSTPTSPDLPTPPPSSFPPLLLLLSLLFPLLSLPLIHADYTTFLSLGPGGTPPTPLGYLKTKLLSLITLRNTLTPPPLPPHFRPQSGLLSSETLPYRPGPRPLVRGIAPQRQGTQRSSPAIYKMLVDALRAVVQQSPSTLTSGTSCFEPHSHGIFARTPILRTRCGGEVCHAHGVDGSLHVVLHPADARVVLERGWGERHPLARGGWCRRFVPKEFVLVYAPRTEGEVRVVMGIVGAGVWWVAGVEVGGGEGEVLEGGRLGKGEVGEVNGRGEGDVKAGVLDETCAREVGAACRMCTVHGCGMKEIHETKAETA